MHGQSVVRSDEIVCACDNSFMVQATISPCDVLIIGAGVMGMLSALELAEAGQDVLILDKGQAGLEASWARGGLFRPSIRGVIPHQLPRWRLGLRTPFLI